MKYNEVTRVIKTRYAASVEQLRAFVRHPLNVNKRRKLIWKNTHVSILNPQKKKLKPLIGGLFFRKLVRKTAAWS